MANHALEGSERTLVKESRRIGRADPQEKFEVRVGLRRRHEAWRRDSLRKLDAGEEFAPLAREDFAAHHGADPDDLAKIRRFASQHGLGVAREHLPSCSVVLTGTVHQFEQAFAVTLERFEHPTMGAYRGRTGPINLPDELHEVVTAVLGLDNRPQARPHFRSRSTDPLPTTGQAPSIPTPFTPLQLAALYDFPPGEGSGQCIGILELGGGYQEENLSLYFQLLGVPMPKIVPIGIGQASNAPTNDPQGPDGEVGLDIGVCGALAPGATLAVYFAANTDAGFLEALESAIHDTHNRPSVISISWGQPESGWTAQAMKAFDEALRTAALLGVTVCVSSGDVGSSDGSADGTDQVDYPASSPYALACGGTSVAASDRSILREVAWNDGERNGATGGGVSKTFAVPLWQTGLAVSYTRGGTAPLTYRGVPDVAGNASPLTGYTLAIDGHVGVLGGTSAVAPLWAALIARINSHVRVPVGFINPRLYRAAGVFNDITEGNNGTYAAGAGWDACTGLGSPKGHKMAKLLRRHDKD
jgi:kumamolisin